MSGVYIHIPFCKVACHYCDFHFSTSTNQMDDMVLSICKELEIRKDFLKTPLETIYFGGGTPSVLSDESFQKIHSTILKNFDTTNVAEYTIETNPDDISEDKLKLYQDLGVTRLSIGIQSFNEPNLSFLNRAHSSIEAIQAIELALKLNFDLTIDLIYGIQTSTMDTWQKDLDIALNFPIEHISAYCLTIEDKTVFGNWLKKKRIKDINESEAINQYQYLIHQTKEHGFEQYEISNFAKNQRYAIHNSNYWKQKPYLGIGPSAHSYDQSSRYANIGHNKKYIDALKCGTNFYEKEQLSETDKINEHLLTSLRTMWGLDTSIIYENKMISKEKIDYFKSKLSKLKKEDLIEETLNCLYLTDKGKLLADHVSVSLFMDYIYEKHALDEIPSINQTKNDA